MRAEIDVSRKEKNSAEKKASADPAHETKPGAKDAPRP
jgi:hypothetical protein